MPRFKEGDKVIPLATRYYSPTSDVNLHKKASAMLGQICSIQNVMTSVKGQIYGAYAPDSGDWCYFMEDDLRLAAEVTPPVFTVGQYVKITGNPSAISRPHLIGRVGIVANLTGEGHPQVKEADGGEVFNPINDNGWFYKREDVTPYKFGVGDEVKITGKFPSGDGNPMWNPEMNQTIGMIGIVKDVSREYVNTRYRIRFPHDHFWYAASSLELIRTATVIASQPSPHPQASFRGTVRVIDENSAHVTSKGNLTGGTNGGLFFVHFTTGRFIDGKAQAGGYFRLDQLDIDPSPSTPAVQGTSMPSTTQFKVGDKVRIARKFSGGPGWTDSMDKYIGTEATISGMYGDRATLRDNHYSWLTSAFDLVTAPATVSPLTQTAGQENTMKNIKNAAVIALIAPYITDLKAIIAGTPASAPLAAAPTLSLDDMVRGYSPCASGQRRLKNASRDLGHELNAATDQFSLSSLLRIAPLEDVTYIYSRHAAWKTAALQYALLDVTSLILAKKPVTASAASQISKLLSDMYNARRADTSGVWKASSTLRDTARNLHNSTSVSGDRIPSALYHIAGDASGFSNVIDRLSSHLQRNGITGDTVAIVTYLIAEALDIREGVAAASKVTIGADEFEIVGYVDGVPTLKKVVVAPPAPARTPQKKEVWKRLSGTYAGQHYAVVSEGDARFFINLGTSEVKSRSSLLGNSSLADWEFTADTVEAYFRAKLGR
jgi:hypothetical protein